MKKLPSLEVFAVLLDHGVKNVIDMLVYKIISLRKKFNQQIEVDAIALQKRINKLCKNYGICEKTARRAVKRLAASGVIKIVYELGFGKYVIEAKSLSDLLGHNCDQETDQSDDVVDENQDVETDAEVNAPKTGIDQQQLIYADQKCRSVGMTFQKKDLWKIAKYPRELISIAIEHYRFARDRNHIPSPTGWLICCLRDKWYLNFKPEKFVPSAQEKFFELQDWFLENFGSLPTRAESGFWRRTPAPSQ